MSQAAWTKKDTDRLADLVQRQHIQVRHDELCEKLMSIKSKVLTHEAMYQVLEQIRKDYNYSGTNDKQKAVLDELREEYRRAKKELFLFRLRHGLKHN